MIDTIFSKIKLNNGYEMPRYGTGPDLPDVEATYGAWNVSGAEEENIRGIWDFMIR